MKIAVYLGSANGRDPIYVQTAIATGHWIADHNHTLVYGGAKVGMMGELARACKAHGGKVIGVIPSFMMAIEKQEASLDECIVTQTMSERRNRMMELADSFVVLPGGMGTLDELSEVISNLRLHLLTGDIFIVNPNGYYDALQSFFQSMMQEGFYDEEDAKHIHFVKDVEEIGGWIS